MNPLTAEEAMQKAEPVSVSDVTMPATRRPVLPYWYQRASRYLGLVALAFASFLFISHFLLQSVRVVGTSMFPTLQDSQSYLLNRWVFYVRRPHFSDVVVLRDPTDNGFSVKRVVAEAGDSVVLREGKVYVNGKRLREPYLVRGTATFPLSGAKEQSFTCGRNQYFLLGDNRNNSIDSRVYGPVPRGNILGLIIP